MDRVEMEMRDFTLVPPMHRIERRRSAEVQKPVNPSMWARFRSAGTQLRTRTRSFFEWLNDPHRRKKLLMVVVSFLVGLGVGVAIGAGSAQSRRSMRSEESAQTGGVSSPTSSTVGPHTTVRSTYTTPRPSSQTGKNPERVNCSFSDSATFSTTEEKRPHPQNLKKIILKVVRRNH